MKDKKIDRILLYSNREASQVFIRGVIDVRIVCLPLGTGRK